MIQAGFKSVNFLNLVISYESNILIVLCFEVTIKSEEIDTHVFHAQSSQYQCVVTYVPVQIYVLELSRNVLCV